MDSIGEALKGAEVVVIPAGVPRKPGMTRDDLFNINAGIVKALAEATAEHAPGVRLNSHIAYWMHGKYKHSKLHLLFHIGFNTIGLQALDFQVAKMLCA